MFTFCIGKDTIINEHISNLTDTVSKNKWTNDRIYFRANFGVDYILPSYKENLDNDDILEVPNELEACCNVDNIIITNMNKCNSNSKSNNSHPSSTYKERFKDIFNMMSIVENNNMNNNEGFVNMLNSNIEFLSKKYSGNYGYNSSSNNPSNNNNEFDFAKSKNINKKLTLSTLRFNSSSVTGIENDNMNKYFNKQILKDKKKLKLENKISNNNSNFIDINSIPYGNEEDNSENISDSDDSEDSNSDFKLKNSSIRYQSINPIQNNNPNNPNNSNIQNNNIYNQNHQQNHQQNQQNLKNLDNSLIHQFKFLINNYNLHNSEALGILNLYSKSPEKAAQYYLRKKFLFRDTINISIVFLDKTLLKIVNIFDSPDILYSYVLAENPDIIDFVLMLKDNYKMVRLELDPNLIKYIGAIQNIKDWSVIVVGHPSA